MENQKKLYSKFRKEQFSSFIKQREIPVEDYISLPIPSFKEGKKLYSFFSCPSRKRVSEEDQSVIVEYGSVNKIWDLLASNGTIFSFQSLSSANNYIRVREEKTISEMIKLTNQFDDKMDIVEELFFNKAQPSENLKNEMLRLFGELISPDLLVIYKKYNSDFFNWLSK